MNFARLNHILIPTTKDERDRVRHSLLGRLFRPLTWIYVTLSEEGRFVLFAALVAGIAGLDVANTDNHILWCALFAAIIAALVLRPLFRMPDVRLEVRAPQRISVGGEAHFLLTLENTGDREYHALRFWGPLLPWDGRWARGGASVGTLPAQSKRSVTVSARFSSRGRHQLDSFHAAALVPFGLTVGRAVASRGTTFLVVPRIAPVEHVEIPMGARYQLGGVALASKIGESMELLGVRAYRSGDRLRDLHPRSWARTGFPMVREYQQEYFSRLGVIVDTDITSADERHLEAALSLAAGVIAHLTRGESLIDVLVTGDQIHSLTLGRSLGFLDQALDHLACVEGGGKLEASRLLERLAPFVGRLSAVVLVLLSWDRERQALVDGLRRAGVGCRAVVVRGGAGASGRDVTFVSAEAIVGGEAILL